MNEIITQIIKPLKNPKENTIMREEYEGSSGKNPG